MTQLKRAYLMKLSKIGKIFSYIPITFYIYFYLVKLALVFYLSDFKSMLNETKVITKPIKNNSINPQHLPKILSTISLFLRIKSCLIISVALFKSFKKINEKASLFIGVIYEADKFSSHAWVEHDGKEYFEGKSKNYNRVLEFK